MGGGCRGLFKLLVGGLGCGRGRRDPVEVGFLVDEEWMDHCRVLVFLVGRFRRGCSS